MVGGWSFAQKFTPRNVRVVPLYLSEVCKFVCEAIPNYWQIGTGVIELSVNCDITSVRKSFVLLSHPALPLFAETS